MNRRRHVHGGEPPIRPVGDYLDPFIQQVLEKSSDDVKGEPEHQPHDGHESGNGGPLAGEEAVQFLASNPLLAFLRFNHRLMAQPANKGISHIRHGGAAVHAALLFHLASDFLHHFLFVLCKRQRLRYQRVPFNQFRDRKPNRNAGRLCVIAHQTHDAVNRPVHGTVVILRIAEIHPTVSLTQTRDAHGVLGQLLHPLVFRRRGWNDRHLKDFFHLINQHRTAVSRHLIHHVQGDDDGNVQLQQLHGEVQVSLNIGSIDDVDNRRWFLFQNKLPGDDFLAGVRGKGVDARQIHHFRAGISFDHPALSIHCYPRKISDVLIGPG